MTDRGCMGLASVYSHTSATCGGCVARTPCGEKAFEALQRVRTAIKVDDLIERFQLSFVAPEFLSKTRKLTLEQTTRINSMPVKVRGRLENLMLDGFDHVAAARFQKGENPFKRTGAKHMHLAGQLLLSGGFTKALFRTECIERYGWTPNTAFSQVSQAIALLRGLGLIHETNERIELK